MMMLLRMTPFCAKAAVQESGRKRCWTEMYAIAFGGMPVWCRHALLALLRSPSRLQLSRLETPRGSSEPALL